MAKSIKSKQEKLQNIENSWNEIGDICVKSFHTTREISMIRAGVTSHRCAMQAIRDQVRYFSVKK